MKKIFTLVVLLISATNYAQVDFESYSLPSESYENGSSGGGDFILNSITLSNNFDMAWASWNGFAISNITDNATPGFGNQYSAFPGAGNGPSSNYGVFYPSGYMSLGSGGYVLGFYITNDTYSAISMRDGDAFSKQFGSPNDANGVPDGTNGEDFFRVWIIAENDLGIKDSLVYYLADFRFPNDIDDYIVDTWEYVSLASLGVLANTVSFRFESSDVGPWGINTPTYFAIDDIDYELVAEIESVSNPIAIYPNPATDMITIEGVSGTIEIYSLSGELVLTEVIYGTNSIDVSALNYGIYLVNVSNTQEIYTEKLIIR